MTNTESSKNEISLLHNGFKHSLQPNNRVKYFEQLAIETEIALKNSKEKLKITYIGSEIINGEIIKNYNSSNTDFKIFKSIKEKSENKNIKGNTIVALKDKEYVNKILGFINKRNYKI